MELKCSCCGEKLDIHNIDFVITVDDKLVCFNCISKNSDKYRECRTCCRYFLSDNESYCQDCINDIFKKPINQYSTKITGIFNNKNNNSKCLNNRYYGLEMEYNNINPRMMQLLLMDEYKNHNIYGKSDGSISNGVEVVTVPMDRHSVNTFLDRIKDSLKLLDNDLTSRNAGLHIHVSRNSIPKEVITKLSILFNYKTEEKYINALYHLCGRQSRNMDSDGYYRAGALRNIKYINRESVGHNVAFNNANTNTVEFRIFKSITDSDVLKMYIDIVDSAIDFCSKNGFAMININNFICYLGLTTKNELIKKRLEYIHSEYKVGEHPIQNVQGIANLLEELLKDKLKDYREMDKKLRNNQDLYRRIKEALANDILKGEKKCV